MSIEVDNLNAQVADLVVNKTAPRSVIRAAFGQLFSMVGIILDTKQNTTDSHFKGKYPTLTALQTAVPVGSDGDYAIVTTDPSDQEYIWDSDHSNWFLTENTPASTFALLGGVPTDNTALAAAFSSRDTAINTEASTRASADITIQNQLNALSAALIPHPTYTAPTASISSTQTTVGLEIGQAISISLIATFNQNNGGISTALSIKKSGAQISTTTPYIDSGVVMSAAAIVYQCSFTYAQGPILNNILGIPDATGRIGAGSVNSGSLSYVGSYGMYYGPVSALPTTSAQVKALSKLLRGSGNVMNLVTGIVNTIFVIVLPPGVALTKVIDTGNLNLDVTANFTANTSTITVTDAGGNNVTYTMYAKIQATAYNPSTTFQITTT